MGPPHGTIQAATWPPHLELIVFGQAAGVKGRHKRKGCLDKGLADAHGGGGFTQAYHNKLHCCICIRSSTVAGLMHTISESLLQMWRSGDVRIVLCNGHVES